MSTESPTVFTTSTQPMDVEVQLGKTILHLHSAILRHCSSVFDARLSERWWSGILPENEGHIKYKYRLVKEPDGDSEWSLLPAHKISQLPKRPEEDEDPPVDIIQTFTRLFKAMYHRLDPREMIISTCKSLAELADMYDAIVCVRMPFENYLSSITDLHVLHSTDLISISIKVQSETLYRKTFSKLVRHIEDGEGGKLFGYIPDYTMARAYRAAYDSCPNHGKGRSFRGCENCGLEDRYSKDFPWEDRGRNDRSSV